MATEVIVTDVFLDWYSSLTEEQQFPVKRVVSLLEEFGLTLPFPYSYSLRGTRYPLRELRTQAEGEPYRILYAFDPRRQAVRLLGGNKIGQGNRWYEGAIRQAEALWEEYRRDVGTPRGKAIMKTYQWSEIEHKGAPEEISRAKQEARAEFEGYAAFLKARESTELELAERLGLARADVLALEELHLQVLGKHLRAQGGELKVCAIFPDTSFDLEPAYNATSEDAAA